MRWNKNLLQQIGNRRTIEVFRMLRATGIPRPEYEAFKITITSHWEQSPLVAPNWATWAQLIHKYQLTQTVNIVDLKQTVITLDRAGILGPFELSSLTKSQVQAMETSLEGHGWITLLWQTVKCHFDSPSNSATARFHANPRTLPILLTKIRGKSIEDTDIRREYTRASAELGLPPNFDGLTPGAKVKALTDLRAEPTAILELLARGADLNIMRTVKSSLPEVRSGINSYIRFCTLVDRPVFSPTAATVLLWSTTFNPGKTFGQYSAHLQKATLLLNQPLDWLTPQVRATSKGLKNSQDLGFKFPNFLRSDDLITISGWTKLDTLRAKHITYPIYSPYGYPRRPSN